MKRRGPSSRLFGRYLFALVACALPTPAAQHPDVILISIDTLRADHLSCYGYRDMATPAVDGLAAAGVRFHEHTATVPLTLPSHCSMLTGLYPPHHGVRDNGGFALASTAVTLAERFRMRGYRTGAFVGSFVLDRRCGLDQGFDVYDDDLDVESAGSVPIDLIQRRADAVLARARAFLERPGPRFCFIHLYDPHTPYEPPEGYRASTRFPLYDGEIAYTDAQLGLFFRWLKDQGLFDPAVILLTGDHGESLGEHGESTHGFFLYRATLQVPLIIKPPKGQGAAAGTFRHEITSTVDIAPTLLGFAGERIECDGEDLFGEPTSARHLYSESYYPRYHYGWSELVSVTDPSLHFIEAPRPELYEYRSDPTERVNIFSTDVVNQFRSALERFRAGAVTATVQAADMETLEQLRSLGYTGGVVPAPQDASLADPKDKILIYNSLKQAEELVYRGHEDEAVRMLEDLVRADAALGGALVLMGEAHSRRSRWREAVDSYSKALALLPDDLESLFGRAVARRRAGDRARAAVDFSRVLQIDAANNRARYQLAEIAEEEGRHVEALDLLERVIADGRQLGPPLALRAKALLALGRRPEAEESLQRALAAEPSLVLAHFNLGVMLEDRGALGEAEAEYRRELSAGAPGNHMAAFNLARLLERTGRRPEALQYYRRSIEADSTFGAGYVHLARVLMEEADRVGEAYELCLKAQSLELDQSTAILAHLVRADICSRMGRSEEAQRELAEARRLQAEARH